MNVFLVDGTYELFRHYYGAPAHETPATRKWGQPEPFSGPLLGMLEAGATHMGVATDHVIESWRNDAWPTYKSSAGVPEDLLGQFPLFEEALASMGLVVWAMTDLEADDALAIGRGRPSPMTPGPTGSDLHARQGSRPVRERREGRLPGPAQDAIVDEEAVRAPLRRRPEPRSPTGWLVGRQRRRVPGLAGLGPKAAQRSSAGTAPSKPSRPPPRPGKCPCRLARWPSWLRRSRKDQEPPSCSRSWPPAWSTATSSPPGARRWTAWRGEARRPGSPTCADRWRYRPAEARPGPRFGPGGAGRA